MWRRLRERVGPRGKQPCDGGREAGHFTSYLFLSLPSVLQTSSILEALFVLH